jgi:hypothetical protein
MGFFDRPPPEPEPPMPPRPGRMKPEAALAGVVAEELLLPAEFLRLGVQFADGSVATHLDRSPFRRPDAWPLPPPGPVGFICQWPAQGIAESRVEIDARLILAAAARAVDLWTEDGQASDREEP